MFKTTLLAGCALACVALSACVSPGAITGTGMPQAGVDPAVLKEVNRHLELCDRTYTFAWPPSGSMHCAAQTAPPPSAAEIQAMIETAVSKAAAGIAAANAAAASAKP